MSKPNKRPSEKNTPHSRQKKDIIVAVRMPKGLIDELKDLQKINHFMDISDEIRFVIRKYSMNIGQGISQGQGIDQNIELLRKEKLISDLSKIIEGLKANSK